MTKWVMCALCLAVTMLGCQPAQPSGQLSEAERQQLGQRLDQYFRKAANLTPDITMKLTDVSPAPIPGLLMATLQLSNGTNTQDVPLILSRDGHYLIQGQLTDLTVDPDQVAMAKISLKDVPMRGNPKATVTVVEFSDFQCPFCGRAYKTLEDQVLKEYGGKIRFVFKNFPLTNIHPWAESGALASACARQQSPDAFWKVYDFLFQKQSTITPESVKENVEGVMRDGGFDVAKFDACFDNKAALDAVKADTEEANALGVRSTPTFFINGHKIEGALPYDSFKQAIDAALNASSAGSSTAKAS